MPLRIGITCSLDEWPSEEAAQTRLANYALALEDAGAHGEYLFLASNTPADAARLASQLDGLLITGGADLPPETYDEEPREGANLSLVPPARPALEYALCDAFTTRDKPIFGICYGCQFLNVWAGGALLQDITLQKPDCIEHRDGVRHMVRAVPGSALAALTEQIEFEVNSFHHQGIALPAQTALATAHAPDGIIEALELPGAFVRGVQWHPERDRADAVTLRLFAAFSAACR